MGRFHLTERAEEDLREIARYTVQTWGKDQTIRYIESFLKSAAKGLPIIRSWADAVTTSGPACVESSMPAMCCSIGSMPAA